MTRSISALLLPASVVDHAAFALGEPHTMPPIGDVASVTAAVNAALGRRTTVGRLDPSTGLFLPESVESVSLVTDAAGHVRSISATAPNDAVLDALAELGLHVFGDDGTLLRAPSGVRTPPPSPPATPHTATSPAPYPVPTAYAPPRYTPPAPTHPSPGSITAALIIEAVMTTLTILIVLLVSSVSVSQGNPPPTLFLFAMFILCATMVLRCASVLFVRRGYAWARGVYVAVAAVGLVSMLAFPSMPIVGLHFLTAVATTILIFIRPAREWLAWSAATRV